jgi:hypothetical protein
VESSLGRYWLHSERMLKNEQIQPFLVAARGHSVVGGDRLQEQQRRQLRVGGERNVALREHELQWSNRQRGRDNVFIYAKYVGRVEYVGWGVDVLAACQRRLPEYVFVHAVGNGQHPLTIREDRRRFRMRLATVA